MKMSTVVRKSSKIIAPFLFTYGAYLIIYGHLSPGGGFQGGVILAVGVVLLLTSHGYRLVRSTFRERLVKMIESSAALGIVILGLTGLIFNAFFYNYLRGGTIGTLFSGGTIVIFNILVGLKIGTGFTIVFYILLRRMERD
ncbi:MAG: Na(+)/H(+) antiporter subunit B [Candidatus Thermoplasmatota archaeon]|nr:Na(+)/H(+) antiporter subunit B [Candidatus Thermoplasmatota archaeon]MBS3789380.1 Na(+)/H(+) antiporter subunit B [Candidatus Thermoplasmatota archaeon]